ncbi:hypothetical protein Aduo_003660 [Ancylostoma duodenale]
MDATINYADNTNYASTVTRTRPSCRPVPRCGSAPRGRVGGVGRAFLTEHNFLPARRDPVATTVTRPDYLLIRVGTIAPDDQQLSDQLSQI